MPKANVCRNSTRIMRLLSAGVCLLAVGWSGAVLAEPSGTLRWGVGFEPQGWNPQVQPNTTYIGLVYEGLLEMASDGVTIKPRLAEAWSISPTEMTFQLRQGVTFHDGTPFNADAVIANIESLQKAANRWQETVSGIAKVVKVDDYNVKFELKHPSPSLPYTLTQPGLNMVSPRALADGSWKTSPVGTGPYVYKEDASVQGSKYVFDHYDKYYALGDVGPAQVEVHYLADGASRYNALLAGQVDAVDGDPSQLEQAEAAGLKNHTWTMLRYHLIMLDRKGVFGDARVRKAMCMATPVEQISVGLYAGLLKFPNQRFDEGDPSHVADLKGYAYDIEGAKALLAEAGTPKVSFKLPSPDFLKLESELVKESFGKAGIEVEIALMPPSEYFQNFYSGQYPLIVNTMTAEYGGMFNYYPFRFSAAGKANTYKVDPPARLEAAYQEALAAPTEAQAPLLQEMTRIIHDEALDCGFMDIAGVVHYDPKRITSLGTTTWEPSALRYKEVKLAQ